MPGFLRGHVLIAARHLRDSNFYKTVVLLVEHNDGGAMGLVINRPLDVSVSDALGRHFEMPQSRHHVFSGGPVEPNALLILHNSSECDQEHAAIVPGVYVGTSADIFDRVAAEAASEATEFQFRIFSGYSGWGAGQLEEEISRGDWFFMAGDARYVFNGNPYGVWEEVLREFRLRHRILSSEPADPELN